MDSWYFAYGSNLDVEQKESRTGTIREARRAKLAGYRLLFNKRGSDGTGKANIEPAKESVVWGVVYRCNRAAFEAMDRYEGVRSGHYRRGHVRVQTDSGEELEAITYLAERAWILEGLAPSREYLDLIISGAKRHGLPAEHVSYLESMLTPGGA